MSNIIPFDSTAGAAGLMTAPEHALAAFGEEGNIAARISIDQLSYRGKVWRRVVDGEETTLTRPSQDSPGETEPVPVVKVVILDHNKGRSRAFYPEAYEEGKNATPSCFSADGVTPDAGVKEPCAATCAACPNSVKGSKITDNGKQSTLCSPFKRIALVPSGKQIGLHPALLLRLAQTSMWDKDNKDNESKGWYAWDQYLDMLRARGAKHTAMVETAVKFDTRMAYPKLLFSASRWLNPDEVEAAKTRLTESAEAISNILTGGDRDGVAGNPPATPAPAAQDDDGFGSVAADEGAAAAAAAAKAADDKAKADAAEKAQKKAAKAAAAAKAAEAAAKAAEAAAAAAAAAEEDDEGGFGAVATPAAAAPAAKAAGAPKQKTAPAATPSAAATPVASAPVVEGAPAALSDLLSNWDDD